MFRFESQEYLFWLWIIPIVVVAGFFTLKWQKKKISKIFGAKIWAFLTSSLSNKKRRAKWILECLVLAFLILALARPQLGSSLQEVKSEGVEMVILFDVSTSMMAEDVKPSRLELAKSEVKKLLGMTAGDKVGLVAFAGSAFLMSPLTTDYSALSMYIDSLSPESVSSQGTEIKPALEEAEQAFKRGGAEEDEHSKATRVILVVSDGEDHEEGALTLARKLNGEGIKIYTMGLGTEQGASIPERDEFGYLKGYKKDEKGQVITTAHKGEFMRKLAAAGGGTYSYIVGGGAQMDALKKELNRLEKAQFETQMATEYDERFQVPLAIAVILALIELLLGERKKVLATRKQYSGGEVT